VVNSGFITFADGSRAWKDAAKRICLQATESGFFTTVDKYDLSSIKDRLTERDKDFITENPFGFGYFLFKPIVILLFLERNPQLEVVVYLDAGSEIDSSPQKLQTFNEYLSLSSKFGYVGFQLPNKEVNWSKADLCELVGSSKDDLQSGQIAGGHLIFNRDFAFEHCSAWLEIMRKDNYHFLDDSPSRVSNAPNFVSHRHDQSISSLLLKKSASNSLRSAEEMEPHFGSLESQSALGPFIAARNSSRISRLNDNLLKRIIRKSINSYYYFIEVVLKCIPRSNISTSR
jgi:hypothetical protein